MTERGAIPEEQIIFGKPTLFQAMYHHPKVRAAECLFKGIVERLMTSSQTLAGRQLKNPADFIRLTDADFLTRVARTEDPQLVMMLRHLVDRRLPVKAIRLDRRSVGYTPEGEDVPDGVANLWRLLPGGPRERYAQYSDIKDLRKKIRDGIMGEAGRSVELGEVWLDIPFLPSLGQAPLSVNIRGGEPTFLETFPSEQWAGIYKTHRYKAHVFVPRPVVDVGRRVAAEVLNEAFDIELQL